MGAFGGQSEYPITVYANTPNEIVTTTFTDSTYDAHELKSVTTLGDLIFNTETQVARYTPTRTGTDEFILTRIIHDPDDTGVDNALVEHKYTLTVREFSECPPEICRPQPMQTVAARKSNDDKFDDFAIYSGVAILGTWAFNKYIVNAPVKFTAMPTSNKSLQYNLSANINKNWSANFTVNKTVKINSETNNSNLYKLKFEYSF